MMQHPQVFLPAKTGRPPGDAGRKWTSPPGPLAINGWPWPPLARLALVAHPPGENRLAVFPEVFPQTPRESEREGERTPPAARSGEPWNSHAARAHALSLSVLLGTVLYCSVSRYITVT